MFNILHILKYIWKILYIYIYIYIYACMLSCFSCVQLFVTPWTVACQVSLSMEFCKQEYWAGLPCLSLGYFPNPGNKPVHPYVYVCIYIYIYICMCVCVYEDRERKKKYRNHITLCYASGYCSVISKRKFPGLCFFSSVTADIGLSGYVEKNVTGSSVHGNFKSRKGRSQVNISRDPQGVSRSIKLFVHLYTVHNQHLLARGHRLSTFHMQQGKGLWQGGLSIGMHKLC